MAQSTTAISGKDLAVEQSVDGSTWVDVSGEATKISVSGGERITGSVHTADGDTPILKAGKRNPITVTLEAVYTETGDEAYDDANDAYEGASAHYLRWFPAGTTAANLKYTTAAGIVKNPVYPDIDPSSGDPVLVTIVLETTLITEGAAT